MFHGNGPLARSRIAAIWSIVAFGMLTTPVVAQNYSTGTYIVPSGQSARPSAPIGNSYPSYNFQPVGDRTPSGVTYPARSTESRVRSVSAPIVQGFSQPQNVTASSPLSTISVPTNSAVSSTQPAIKLNVSEAEIQSAGVEVNQSATLTADEKALAQATLQRAIQWLQQARGDSLRASQLNEEMRTAPSRLASLQRYLATPTQSVVRLSSHYSLNDLLSQRERLSFDLASANNSYAEMVARYGGEALASAGGQWSRQLSETESELQSLVATIPVASLTSIESRCQDLQLRAHKDALQTRIELLRRQMKFNESHSELFTAELASARRSIQEIGVQIAAIDEAVENHKASSAHALGDRARSIASTAHPLVGELAAGNAALADQLATLSNSRRDVNSRVDATQQKLRALREDYENVRTKLAQYGLTPTVGMLLRHRRDSLDPVHVHVRTLQDTRTRIHDTQRQQLEMDLQRAQLSDLDSEADRWIADSQYAGLIETERLRPQVQQMLAERREIIDRLTSDFQLYQKRLEELDTASSDSVACLTSFRGLIDKHVTWIRSGTPLEISDVRTAWTGLGALFDSRRSERFGTDLQMKLSHSPLYGFYLIFAIAAVGLIRWKCKRTLVQIGKQRQLKQLGLRWTVAAAAITALLSLIFPTCFYLIAQWLGDHQATTEALVSVASGFYSAALVLWMIELPRQLTRPYGIVDKHMDWKLPSRQRAFKTLSILAMILVPLAMGVAIASQMDQGRWRESLGRIGFLMAMLIIAVVAHRALRPKLGFIPSLILASRNRWAYRFRHLLYVLGVGFPIAMAILSASGFGYTSQVLLTRLIVTGLMLGLLWLVITIAQSVAAQLWTIWADDGDGRAELVDDDAELGMELRASYLRRQKYDLLQQRLAFLSRCGVAFAVVTMVSSLWSDIIPNVRFANPTLWTIHEVTTEHTASIDGGEIAKLVPSATAITLVDLLFAAATLFFTYHLSRTLPLVLDVLVLDFMVRDEGMHHLLLVAGRAVLAMIGIVAASNQIGLRWETIQWLVVALLIGLGFGMQDMVRNFIGGLFVLLEKPAGPGDLVTIGKLTGRVAFQRLRTTALVDDQGRELIIPNRKFMSEDVTNWTGAGRLCPLTMEIEMSKEIRGSDASAMLLAIASRHPSVMTDPEPKTTFLCLGKRTQQLELRVWLDKKTDATKIRSELQSKVDSMLRSNSIGASSGSVTSPHGAASSTLRDRLSDLRPRRRSA